MISIDKASKIKLYLTYYRSLGQCSCLTEIIRNHIGIKQRQREDRFRNIMARFRSSYEAMAKEDENEEGWD